MSDRDADEYLFEQPLDPERKPRAVELDVILEARDRQRRNRAWLIRASGFITSGFAMMAVLWQAVGDQIADAVRTALKGFLE